MSKKRGKRKGGRASGQGAPQPSLAKGGEPAATLPFGAVAWGLLPFSAIALLVLAQGGYYSGIVSACGIVLALAAAARQAVLRRCPRVQAMMLLLFGVAGLYAVSAAVNGVTLTSISAAAFWFAVAGMSLACGQMNVHVKEAVVRWLCWFGVCCAVFGFLVFCQVLPLEGSVSAGRLQFTFQYANAAGIWFAVIAFLCFSSKDARLRAAALLPILALLLTQSTGAIVLFAAACVVSALFRRPEGAGRFAMIVAQGMIALALFAGMRLAPGPVGLAFPAAGVAVCYALWCNRGALDRLNARHVAIAVAALFAVVLAVLVLLQSERLVEASQTFIERFIQVLDAAGLLAASPVLGIGPDLWRYAYPYAQTAQYTASVVHCGYAQIALDAGLAGLTAFCAAIAFGLRGLAKRGDVASLLAAGLILIHSLVDFDLRFGALAFLVVFLLADEDGAALVRVPAAAASAAMGVIVAFACAAGLWAEGVRGRLDAACAAGDAAAVERLAGEYGTLRDDVAATTCRFEALARAGAWEDAVSLYGQVGASSGEQAVLAAQALFETGSIETAGRVLVEELEREPYQVKLFEQAEALFDEYGVDEAIANDYLRALDRAGDLSKEGHAAWLDNQEEPSSAFA